MVKYNKYWFKPKRYGYGAYPCSWEGWLVIILFLLFLFGIASYHDKTSFDNYVSYILELLVLAIILVFISFKKTKEEWKWRWGKK